MTQPTQHDIEAAVGALVDPFNGADLAATKAVQSVQVGEGRARVALTLGYPSDGLAQQLGATVHELLAQRFGIANVEVAIDHRVEAHAVQQGAQAIDGVSNVIAVASGKGGVGKSTVAVNLALALAAEGARTGILDADVYGPSQPTMLGSSEKPRLVEGDERRIRPIVSHGVQCMSVGFLVDADNPMIWRGPMATQALEQLARDTAWDALDYLIVDLPPGTGDIQLTLAQRIPVSCALIVTTPQDIALLDAVKGLKMFEKVRVPVFGVIENMATHVCSQCGHEEAIFGSGGGERMAREHGLDLLGRLPLAMDIRAQTDAGRPTVVAEPDGAVAHTFRDIGVRTAARLALRGRDYARKFPKISIVNE